MAEYMLRSMLGPDDVWDVASAGTLQMFGVMASPQGVEAMEEIGVDMGAHRSQGATRDLLSRSDLIVALAQNHVEFIHSMYPELSGKVRLFTSFDPSTSERSVADPVGMPVDEYRDTRDQLRRGMPALIESLRGIARS